jgi:hypothetical protein
VLGLNPVYSTLSKVSDILCGKETEMGENNQKLSANDLTILSIHPLYRAM